MNDEKIAEALQEEKIEKEIRCPQAFAIAKKYQLPLKAIGDYCTAHNIKIRGCQLGCFK